MYRILLPVLLFLLILSFKDCNNNKSLARQQIEMNKLLRDTAKTFELLKNDLGQQVAHQKIIILQKDKQIENEILRNSKLNSISAHYKVQLDDALTKVKVQYIDTSKNSMTIKEAVEKLPENTNVIIAGAKFQKLDKWYKIKGSVEKDGVQFDSLAFYNDITMNIGMKRKPGVFGFLKKKDLTYEVINSNPYSNVKSLSSISFNDNKNIFDSKLFNLGVGVCLGILIGNFK